MTSNQELRDPSVIWMAIDQRGNEEHGLRGPPRKALLERLERKSAKKMYVDRKDGTSVHVGYVVGGRWFTLYRVTPFERC